MVAKSRDEEKCNADNCTDEGIELTSFLDTERSYIFDMLKFFRTKDEATKNGGNE
jgi:hypothetical protein